MLDNFDGERINRYFNDDDSKKDEHYINEIFCSNICENELRSLLSDQFDSLEPEDEIFSRNLDHILYRIHYDINMTKQEQNHLSFQKFKKWGIRIAGAIILPIAILFGIQTFKEYKLNKDSWVEIIAPAWTRAQFSLPDGTTGWLNSNSGIKYKTNFFKDRTISLTGEAYFNVKKDLKRPFIVNTSHISVKVLGTKFNIASYQNDPVVEVVLEEGKLELKDNDMKSTHVMNPDDLYTYDKVQKSFSSEKVQSQKYYAWTEGKLVFRNDPLNVIAARLKRWYNIDIEVNMPESENIRWRATFIDENLEEVLEFLKRSLPVDYEIIDQTLQSNGIYSKKKVIITSKTN